MRTCSHVGEVRRELPHPGCSPTSFPSETGRRLLEKNDPARHGHKSKKFSGELVQFTRDSKLTELIWQKSRQAVRKLWGPPGLRRAREKAPQGGAARASPTMPDAHNLRSRCLFSGQSTSTPAPRKSMGCRHWKPSRLRALVAGAEAPANKARNTVQEGTVAGWAGCRGALRALTAAGKGGLPGRLRVNETEARVEVPSATSSDSAE